MMFVDNTFFNNENIIRLSLAFLIAALVHIIFFVGLSVFQTQKVIKVDLLSAPTNVSIRFIMPSKPTPKVIEHVKPTPNTVKSKPIKKKPASKKIKPKKLTNVTPSKTPPEVLNKIEPAATVQQVRQPTSQSVTQKKSVQKSIPVVSDRRLKSRRVQPKYPDRALRMKQEGIVWIRVLISETGTRQQIKIHQPSQYALLNQAAIKAVKKWTFSPNVIGGQATKSWVEIPIEFKIQ